MFPRLIPITGIRRPRRRRGEDRLSGTARPRKQAAFLVDRWPAPASALRRPLPAIVLVLSSDPQPPPKRPEEIRRRHRCARGDAPSRIRAFASIRRRRRRQRAVLFARPHSARVFLLPLPLARKSLPAQPHRLAATQPTPLIHIRTQKRAARPSFPPTTPLHLLHIPLQPNHRPRHPAHRTHTRHTQGQIVHAEQRTGREAIRRARRAEFSEVGCSCGCVRARVGGARWRNCAGRSSACGWMGSKMSLAAA